MLSPKSRIFLSGLINSWIDSGWTNKSWPIWIYARRQARRNVCDMTNGSSGPSWRVRIDFNSSSRVWCEMSRSLTAKARVKDWRMAVSLNRVKAETLQ